jgi:hypothetical protein
VGDTKIAYDMIKLLLESADAEDGSLIFQECVKRMLATDTVIEMISSVFA